LILNITYSPDEAYKAAQLIHQLISKVYRDQGFLVHEYFMVGGEKKHSNELYVPSITTEKIIKCRGVWRFITSGLVKKIKTIVACKEVRFIVCDGIGVARCMFPVLKRNRDVKLIVVVHDFVKLKPKDIVSFSEYQERVRLVFVSSSLAAVINDRYPTLKDSSHVISNTLTPNFNAGLLSRAESRAELGLSLDAKLYLVASRLTGKKDVSTVIHAFSKIVGDNMFLVVMGDGSCKVELEGLALDLGIEKNVIWLGWVENSSSYLKAFDVFVSASIVEGFGLSVLEAHAAGLPVVCSEIEPHKEMLGENGTYFKVGDADDCAEKVLLASFSTIKCDLDERYQKFSIAYQEIIDF
jgi:glycosyltransferase involved in cell wall biosynthesis